MTTLDPKLLEDAAVVAIFFVVGGVLVLVRLAQAWEHRGARRDRNQKSMTDRDIANAVARAMEIGASDHLVEEICRVVDARTR